MTAESTMKIMKINIPQKLPTKQISYITLFGMHLTMSCNYFVYVSMCACLSMSIHAVQVCVHVPKFEILP